MSKPLTLEDRMRHPKSQIRKLTNILKTLREMTREGLWCEKEIADTAHKIKVIREIYKTRVKMEELKKEAS